ncbi:c-type cytochrome [Halomonas sp. LS-001]
MTVSAFLAAVLCTAVWPSSVKADVLWSSPPASAEKTPFADQRDAVSWRREEFKEIETLVRQLRFDIVNQRDLSKARPSLETLKKLASADNLLPAFIEGSHGAGSDARPDIWEEWDEYRDGFKRLEGSITTLMDAVASDDLAAAAKGLSDVGASCKSCHRGYRY